MAIEVNAEYHREWRRKNPGKSAAANKRYRERHPERVKARRDAMKERTADYGRAYTLRRRYGITVEQFDAMLADQGGRCAICSTDTPGGRGAFHVDHDHDTNKVRGLLCFQCNRGLGHFGDNPDTMNEAIAYLRRHQ